MDNHDDKSKSDRFCDINNNMTTQFDRLSINSDASLVITSSRLAMQGADETSDWTPNKYSWFKLVTPNPVETRVVQQKAQMKGLKIHKMVHNFIPSRKQGYLGYYNFDVKSYEESEKARNLFPTDFVDAFCCQHLLGKNEQEFVFHAVNENDLKILCCIATYCKETKLDAPLDPMQHLNNLNLFYEAINNERAFIIMKDFMSDNGMKYLCRLKKDITDIRDRRNNN